MAIGMKCAWVNRWYKEGNKVDITGYKVLSTGNRTPELVDKNKICRQRSPIAQDIAENWGKWRTKLYENDGNLYSAKIFSNPGITNRMGREIGRSNVFGRRRYEEIERNLGQIKLGELCLEGAIQTKAEIEGVLGFRVTDVEYGKLRDVVRYIRGKYKPVWAMKEKGKTIHEILQGVKKGSSKFRQIISGRGSAKYRSFVFGSIRPINTFWTQMGIEIDTTLVSCGVSLWTIKEANPDFRQFVFKWNQGMIHGNTVISHFGENVDRKCTFCKIKLVAQLKRELNRDPTEIEVQARVITENVPDENRIHIMWECETVINAINVIYSSVWGTNGNVEKETYLMGRVILCQEATQLFMIVNMFIKYKIWRYKLAGVLPNTGCITNDVRVFAETICGYRKWRNMFPLIKRTLNAMV